MNRHSTSTRLAFISLAAVIVFCGRLWAQDKPDDPKKLYLEIAGDYEFQMDSQSLIVNFFEKDGKLFGGEAPSRGASTLVALCTSQRCFAL